MSKELAILIIEDDLVDQMAYSRILSKYLNSAKITVAENIEEAKDYMIQRPFDWVISDFNLPDGTLMDILNFAKSHRMICVSGETEDSKIQFLLDHGIQRFLLKDQQLNYLSSLVELIQLPTEESSPLKNEFSYNFLMDKFDGDKNVINDIINIFLNQSPIDLEELQLAISRRASNSCQHISHRMKSGYRVLGLNIAVQCLEIIETESVVTLVDWDKMQEELEKVKTIFASVESDIPSLLSN